MAIKISGNTVIDDSQNITSLGSASFAGTIDAAGFTVNGTALSASSSSVSTLVESTNGTTIAEAKTDSDGDRVFDLNTVVVGVDMGSMLLGKDEVNTPWQHGIYMDATDSQVNDKTRIVLYGTGSDDTALQIRSAGTPSTTFAVQHNGRANFCLEDGFVGGIQMDPGAAGGACVDVYTDGTKTNSAFRVYSGTDNKNVATINHDGNAAFNLDNQTFGEGVQIFGNSQYGSGVTVYRDSTISAENGAAFRVYDKSTSTDSVTLYATGNAILKGAGAFGQELIAHTDGTGEVKIWKGANANDQSCGVGWSVLDSTTTGAEYNTAMGTGALQNLTTGTRNTATGAYALNKTVDGSYNNAYGVNALYNNTAGSYNIAIGQQSLETNTTGDYNVAVGSYALQNANADSDYITAVGSFALRNVNYAGGADITAIGYNAGSAAGNFANQSTYVGAWSGYTETGGNRSNITCLGYAANCDNNNQVQLGNSATTAFAYAWQTRSDERDKTDIRDTLLGLDFIKSLRPVDFRWDYREDYIDRDPETHEITSVPKDGSRKRVRFHHGLIAQEVKEAADAQGVDFAGYQDPKITGGGDKLSLGYTELIAPLIKAVQELSAENEALKARLDAAGL